MLLNENRNRVPTDGAGSPLALPALAKRGDLSLLVGDDGFLYVCTATGNETVDAVWMKTALVVL